MDPEENKEQTYVRLFARAAATLSDTRQLQLVGIHSGVGWRWLYSSGRSALATDGEGDEAGDVVDARHRRRRTGLNWREPASPSPSTTVVLRRRGGRVKPVKRERERGKTRKREREREREREGMANDARE